MAGYTVTQFDAANINHLHALVTALMFGRSGIQVYDAEVRAQVSYETTQTRVSRAKGKSLTARPP